jgi:hypothetical protein
MKMLRRRTAGCFLAVHSGGEVWGRREPGYENGLLHVKAMKMCLCPGYAQIYLCKSVRYGGRQDAKTPRIFWVKLPLPF